MNGGGIHPPIQYSGSINLTAGTYYPIRIQFGENGGGDNMKTSFIEPGGTRTYFWSSYVYNKGASNFS